MLPRRAVVQSSHRPSKHQPVLLKWTDETDVAGGRSSSSSSITVSMVFSGCNNNIIKIFIIQLLRTALYLSCHVLVSAPNRLGDYLTPSSGSPCPTVIHLPHVKLLRARISRPLKVHNFVMTQLLSSIYIY